MSADARAALERALREALGQPDLAVRSLQTLAGGCISHSARVQTTAGPFFAKWNVVGPPDLFLREADGLRELAKADTGLVIPDVVVARGPVQDAPALIVLELLEPAALDEEALGRGLATLHRLSAPAFGFHSDTYCGSTLQPNGPLSAWPEFYARRRLAPLVDRIAAARGLAPPDRRLYERLIDRLPSLLPEASRPALIHGDLWSGNVLGTRSGPALVDPACCYADREMELGMMTLFGGFSERCFAAYEERWPLAPGWRERNGLYQLYHLLNHELLFGGPYGHQALTLARRYT